MRGCPYRLWEKCSIQRDSDCANNINLRLARGCCLPCYTHAGTLDACGKDYIIRNNRFLAQRRYALLAHCPGGLFEDNTVHDHRTGVVSAFNLPDDVDAGSLLMTANPLNLEARFPDLMQIVPTPIIHPRGEDPRPLRAAEDTALRCMPDSERSGAVRARSGSSIPCGRRA